MVTSISGHWPDLTGSSSKGQGDIFFQSIFFSVPWFTFYFPAVLFTVNYYDGSTGQVVILSGWQRSWKIRKANVKTSMKKSSAKRSIWTVCSQSWLLFCRYVQRKQRRHQWTLCYVSCWLLCLTNWQTCDEEPSFCRPRSQFRSIWKCHLMRRGSSTAQRCTCRGRCMFCTCKDQLTRKLVVKKTRSCTRDKNMQKNKASDW